MVHPTVVYGRRGSNGELDERLVSLKRREDVSVLLLGEGELLLLAREVHCKKGLREGTLQQRGRRRKGELVRAPEQPR